MERITSFSTTADILCALGWLTRKQVDEVLAWQKAELASGRNPRYVNDAVVEHGFCTEEQRAFAEEVRRHLVCACVGTGEFFRLFPSSLGSIMVGLGFVQPADYRVVVDWQSARMRVGRDYPGLQDILIQFGACTQEELEFGLRLQRELIRAREATR